MYDLDIEAADNIFGNCRMSLCIRWVSTTNTEAEEEEYPVCPEFKTTLQQVSNKIHVFIVNSPSK
jgi:hypothetical protein